jgi:hypothetical protein
MNTDEKVELKLTLITEPNVTLRDLEMMRSELFNLLQKELSPKAALISAPARSRSLDPAVVGALSLALLPIAIEKLADLVMKYAELKKDCSVKIKIPIKGGSSAEITYNPRTTSKEALIDWINTIVESGKSVKR